MKKKILFVGLLLSVMCMFTSCLFIYADGEGGYGSGSGSGSSSSYDLMIKNNTGYSGSEIAKVYIREKSSNGQITGNWTIAYDDEIPYVDKYNNPIPLYNNRSSKPTAYDKVTINVPYSGNYDVFVFFIVPGSYGNDDQFEYRYKYEVYISKYGKKSINLSTFDVDTSLR